MVIISAVLTTQASVPKAFAAESETPIVRTSAFYQALNDIYAKLVVIQSLLTDLIAAEAADREAVSVMTANGVITDVVVTVDYATNVSTALVEYRQGATSTVAVSSVVPKDIETRLAKELAITTKQLQSLIHYTYIHGDTLVKIVVALKNSRNISISEVFADTSVKEQTVSPADIDTIITEDFYGLTSVYQAFYDDYLAKVKKGEKPTEVVSFVGEILNLPAAVVLPIIEFTY